LQNNLWWHCVSHPKLNQNHLKFFLDQFQYSLLAGLTRAYQLLYCKMLHQFFYFGFACRLKIKFSSQNINDLHHTLFNLQKKSAHLLNNLLRIDDVMAGSLIIKTNRDA
jgi:hypothetical protein